MRTPDANKCGMECVRANVERVCVKPEKGQCPRCEQLVGEGLDLIHRLEADNSRLNDTIRSLTDLLNAAHEETAAVKRERDALFADIKQCNDCYFCKHYGTSLDVEPCQTCILDFQKQDFKPGFVWRGVCPENAEVQCND